MNLKTLLLFTAVVALLFGLSFLIIPKETLGWYGVIMVPKGGILVARLLGANMLGVAVLAWLARPLGASEARSAIVLSLIVIDGLGFIASLLAQLGGGINNLGWSTVILYLLLFLGLGYFRFIKPKD